MTETGSLGPIDAQIQIGRSVVSAYDYMEWISSKMLEATKTGKLKPVDATMVAQITPGEIQLVNHSLEYAKDLVKEWLYAYKFNEWVETTTHINKKNIVLFAIIVKNSASNLAGVVYGCILNMCGLRHKGCKNWRCVYLVTGKK